MEVYRQMVNDEVDGEINDKELVLDFLTVFNIASAIYD